MSSGDRMRNIQMDQAPREDPGTLWKEDSITEAAFTLRHNMTMEVRQAAVDLPPVLTFNGRLRLQFESEEVWRKFVEEVVMTEALLRKYRAAGTTLPRGVARL